MCGVIFSRSTDSLWHIRRVRSRQLDDLATLGRERLLTVPSALLTKGRSMQLIRAQVTNVDDPEGVGRVRLTLPPPIADSGWVDVASSAACTAHGMVLRPAVGDTALVAALDGRGRDLVVIGFLWTAADRP